MTTVEGYREFCRSFEERSTKRWKGEDARERYGCCDASGCHRYVLDIETYGEDGQLMSRESRVKCHLTWKTCPAGDLRQIIGLYGLLNRSEEVHGE